MRKQVTHIDCPEEWQSEIDFDSHRPMLWLSLENTLFCGSVVEFGCGAGSTAIMDGYCYEKRRKFVSLETNTDYLKYAPKYGWADCGKNYEDFFYPENHALMGRHAFIFIDLAPAEKRKVIIRKAFDMADVFVVHDTEPGAEYVYGLNETLNSFKYRLDYQPEGKPHTTAVSNIVDVTKWVE